MKVSRAMMPTTMPAIAPPERPESEEEGEEEADRSEVGFARALGVTVSRGEEPDVGKNEGEDEEVLALSGALEMVPR